MSDLIRRSELRATFERECIGECGCCKHVKHDPEGCALVDNAPAVDAVLVVRCKDCIYGERYNNDIRCIYHEVIMREMDYCSRGIPEMGGDAE